MLKCIRPAAGAGSIQDIASSDCGHNVGNILSGSSLSRFETIPVRNQVDMGKDLLSSATAYIRLYLLNTLSDDSGITTVAIDNKIEQAVDLVKSHILVTVREEVDLLKEKVKELVERNAQLEYENKFLRAYATSETLATLQPVKP